MDSRYQLLPTLTRKPQQRSDGEVGISRHGGGDSAMAVAAIPLAFLLK